jgi:hypothetical protein
MLLERVFGFYTFKVKVAPAHTINTYRGSRGIDPLILNLDTG